MPPPVRVGLVGFGMICEDTYLPAFECPAPGSPAVRLVAVATRTGERVERYLRTAPDNMRDVRTFQGGGGVADMLRSVELDAVCVLTPDDRHFAAARAVLAAGKHSLVEKPSVLTLIELAQLVGSANEHNVLGKVVYHKLLDPDHMALRTRVLDGDFQHVNSGYCSLLEPRSIAAGQFAEWVTGRNPATYVGVHYVKLIDFTFGPDWALTRVLATGQRGLVGPPDGPTFDSVQQQVVYTHPDRREAAFDVHTGWVNPDNFPGHVEQEVQFRFDNGVWAAHQRKRGVEVTVAGRTPDALKVTPNHHYNADLVSPWGERRRRGYGVQAVERFFAEVAHVEHGGPPAERPARLAAVRALGYNDLAADRNTVAVTQAVEALLAAQVAGHPGSVVRVNGPAGGLALYRPGVAGPDVLFADRV